MSVHLGAGWHLVHLTDRVIELRKSDVLYRRYTNRDGYVRLRAEPGMDRKALVDKALQVALANDEKLALKYGTKEVASLAALQRDGKRVTLARHQQIQHQMAPTFAVPGEEPSHGVKRP